MTVMLASLLLALTAFPQANVQQRTSGWCSPSTANIQGNVTVTCTGVDPKALERLNELLDQKDHEIQEKVRQANEWAERYFELEKRLSEATDDGQLSEEASGYLHAGELDKAETILNSLLKNEEQIVDRAAANHFNMALILSLEFQPAAALSHLEAAYHYRPDNVDYAHQYARALGPDRSQDAEHVYRQNLERIQPLIPTNPAVYLSLEAKEYHNLGTICFASGRLTDAETAYRSAIDAYAELTKTDPSTYLILQAGSLEELGSVYEKMGRSDQAQRNYRDSLAIFKSVAAESGTVYNVDAALLLDHLGGHFAEAKNLADAEAMYEEVLTIGNSMVHSDPMGYGMAVGSALSHLGLLYRQQGKFSEAESAYKQSIATLRQMPSTISVYSFFEGVTFGNLGSLYADSGRFAEAVASDEEAIRIFKARPPDDPNTVPILAAQYHNLGIAQLNLGKFAEAEEADDEAISIYRKLATKDEPGYLPSVAGTLTNLAEVYHKQGQFPAAIDHYGEALNIYRQLAAQKFEQHGQDLGLTLNTIGSLYGEHQNFAEAENYYLQSLETFRNLGRAGYDHRRQEAWVLVNLANLGISGHIAKNKARAYDEQAVDIDSELWTSNPSVYGDEYAAILMTKARLLGIGGPRQKKNGCPFLERARQVASSDGIKQLGQALGTYCASGASVKKLAPESTGTGAPHQY